MPVRKFKNPDQMEAATWLDADDPRFAATIAALWRRAALMAPLRFPPGVYKHRSIDEANRLSEEWEQSALEHQGSACP